MQFFFAESDSDSSLEGKIVSALINPGNIRLRDPNDVRLK